MFARRTRILGGAALATLLTASALVTAATPAAAGPPSSYYTLAFSDEFDGTSVDTSKWNYRTDVKGLSAQRPENVSVGGGAMTIHLRKENYAGMAYT
ncbi:MAG: glycoside hydrolase family 16 protein, partial [Dehalococcoidia bacterium]